jgi:hypothetical protein
MVRMLPRVFTVFALLNVLLLFSSEALASPEAPASCPITQPNGNHPPGDPADGGYGNDALWTNVHMWSEDGTVPVDSGHVMADGEFGA